MKKVDAGFFQRLNDSAYWAEDKKEPQIYSLFGGKDYTDVDYYREYPTIYHLRSALVGVPGIASSDEAQGTFSFPREHRKYYVFSDYISELS